MLDIYFELESIIKAFEQKKLEYALCGGLAMAVYDVPRATIDIDILILANTYNKIKKVLNSLGFKLESAPMYFKNNSIEIIRLSKKDPDSEDILSVDILKTTPVLQNVWEDKKTFAWENGQIVVVSKEGLIQMKKLRNSGQDQDDIHKLEANLK